MNYCEGCGSVEVETDDDNNCVECGEEVISVPEHDAGDMER